MRALAVVIVGLALLAPACSNGRDAATEPPGSSDAGIQASGALTADAASDLRVDAGRTAPDASLADAGGADAAAAPAAGEDPDAGPVDAAVALDAAIDAVPADTGDAPDAAAGADASTWDPDLPAPCPYNELIVPKPAPLAPGCTQASTYVLDGAHVGYRYNEAVVHASAETGQCAEGRGDTGDLQVSFRSDPDGLSVVTIRPYDLADISHGTVDTASGSILDLPDDTPIQLTVRHEDTSREYRVDFSFGRLASEVTVTAIELVAEGNFPLDAPQPSQPADVEVLEIPTPRTLGVDEDPAPVCATAPDGLLLFVPTEIVTTQPFLHYLCLRGEALEAELLRPGLGSVSHVLLAGIRYVDPAYPESAGQSVAIVALSEPTTSWWGLHCFSTNGQFDGSQYVLTPSREDYYSESLCPIGGAYLSATRPDAVRFVLSDRQTLVYGSRFCRQGVYAP